MFDAAVTTRCVLKPTPHLFRPAKREDIMYRALKLIPVVVAVVACAKTEKPPADTAQTVAEAAPAAAPAMTEADIAGTWKGTTTPMGSDSVVSRWTSVCAAGTCKGNSAGSKVTVTWAYTLAGDSAVGVSQPYSDANAKGAKVVDTWVARPTGDNVTGTGHTNLASKPDSVVMRYNFAGTRTR
jgi:hypothetical protein